MSKPPPPIRALSRREPAAGAMSVQLQQTAEDARAFIGAGRADSTKRAYASDWHMFEMWAEANGLDSMPANVATVVLYFTHMAKAGKKVSTINRAKASIAVAHQTKGHSSPTQLPAVRDLMKGIRRTLGTAQRKAEPVLFDDLGLMVAKIKDGTAGLRNRALLTLGFVTALRRSELVALDVDDLRLLKQGIELTVRKSKTDQEGAGRKLGVFRRDDELCPVAAMQAWLMVAMIADGPVFRAVDRHGVVRDGRLTAGTVAELVKKYAAAAGLDPVIYSGHSMRRGFITQAIREDRHERDIMKQTGHKSTQVFRGYIADASVFDNNASEGIGRKP